jgi:ABC-2 type transport system permease protein
MGLFGSMAAAIGSGGLIAQERGIGWNRQLRLSGLGPGRYVLSKVALSLVLALPPILVTNVVGFAQGVRLPVSTWAAVLLLSWFGALPFAALGIIIGYVARPDSVQQISSLVYLLLAVFGGTFVPAEQMPSLMHRIAEWTPAYWVGQLARAPLFHTSVNVTTAVERILIWTVVLAFIGLRRFRSAAVRA